jgi:glutamate-1-semialdehyde 2,1-aminomutase
MLTGACAEAGFAAQFPVVGSLAGMYCNDDDLPVDFAGAKHTDEAAYARFFHAMLAEGIAMAPGAYEALFVGLAHTDDVLEQIAEAAQRAAKVAASSG